MLILGIDAAWTARNPSGLALARLDDDGWRLIAVAADVAAFTRGACTGLEAGPILEAAARIGGRPVDLVTVDMPMSLLPITGRRAADNAVTRAYGGRHAGTHSPSAERPGAIADRLRDGMALAGYALRTADTPAGRLAEVYPHPAIIEVMGLARRLPYKLCRSKKYWPHLPKPERVDLLLGHWADLRDAMEALLPGTAALVPLPGIGAPSKALKAAEDTLDAVVCAAVGVAILEGRAVAFGDNTAAIWVPDGAGRPAAWSVCPSPARIDPSGPRA